MKNSYHEKNEELFWVCMAIIVAGHFTGAGELGEDLVENIL